jgi:archaetidylinositol phosphate synthase
LVGGGDGLVLNRYRSSADPIMEPIARRMSGVNPDTISWLALICAVLAGYVYFAAGEHDDDLLLLALLFVILNAGLDALDGYVARYTGKASRLGDLLDHILDRYADAFMFGGIAISMYCHQLVGLVAIFGVFFTSYIGTQGQAVGLKRNYGGIMGRADRLALLCLFTLLQWGYGVVTGDTFFVGLDVGDTTYHLSILEVFMVVVAVLGNVTALQRGVAAWRGLREMEASGDLAPPETPQGLVVVTTEEEEEVSDTEDDGSPREDGEGSPDEGEGDGP